VVVAGARVEDGSLAGRLRELQVARLRSVHTCQQQAVAEEFLIQVQHARSTHQAEREVPAAGVTKTSREVRVVLLKGAL